MMRRADLLALAAAAAAYAAVPLPARAATPLRVALAATDSSILIPAADAFGYLARAGIAVETQFMTNGAGTMAAMMGGSLDLGATNSLSFLQAREKGLPLKIVSAQAIYRAGAASTALVTGKDSPLRTGRDLAGKVVAVNGLGGSPHIAVRAWIDKNGGDANAVHFVELSYPAMPAALAGARVDAAMIAEPALTAALANGRVLGDAYGAIGPLWISDCIVATEAWLDAHGDDARKLAQALHATALWANRNHDKTADLARALSEDRAGGRAHDAPRHLCRDGDAQADAAGDGRRRHLRRVNQGAARGGRFQPLRPRLTRVAANASPHGAQPPAR
jgi:ABC-type nitrate/sulfonate/bicarbonate transport system substrate-binding protein